MIVEHYIKVITTSMLAVLAAKDVDLPFRYQPKVLLYIPFEEYSNFLERIISMNLDCLNFKLDYYKTALQERGNLLLQLFYYDISAALINEIIMAVMRGKEALIIAHCFTVDNNRPSFQEDKIVNMLLAFTKEQRQEGIRSVRKKTDAYFEVNQLSLHNKLLFRYATLLRIFSFDDSPKRVDIL